MCIKETGEIHTKTIIFLWQFAIFTILWTSEIISCSCSLSFRNIHNLLDNICVNPRSGFNNYWSDRLNQFTWTGEIQIIKYTLHYHNSLHFVSQEMQWRPGIGVYSLPCELYTIHQDGFYGFLFPPQYSWHPEQINRHLVTKIVYTL